MRLDLFGHSHPGRSRQSNEDSYLCLRPVATEDAFLLAVADGMGGHAGGAIASEIAMTTLRHSVTRQLTDSKQREPPWRTLRGAFDEVNQAIWRAASEDSTLSGMGTTLVAALIAGDRATIASIGDSRCYHLEGGELRQITEDHSWAAEQAKLGKLSAKEIESSPFRETITRALGFDEEIEVDLFQVDLVDEDVLILCSDGAHGLLADSEIGRIVRGEDDAETICRQLIEASNLAGGTDNITAAVACLTTDRLPSSSSITRPVLTARQSEARGR